MSILETGVDAFVARGVWTAAQGADVLDYAESLWYSVNERTVRFVIDAEYPDAEAFARYVAASVLDDDGTETEWPWAESMVTMWADNAAGIVDVPAKVGGIVLDGVDTLAELAENGRENPNTAGIGIAAFVAALVGIVAWVRK